MIARHLIAAAAGIALFSITADMHAQDLLTATPWRVTIESHRFGPLETVLNFDEDHGQVTGTSASGSLASIRTLPGTEGASLETSLFALKMTKTDAGYAGSIEAPFPDGGLSLVMTENGIEGKIEGGLLAGSFSGTPAEGTQGPIRDYPAVWRTIQGVVSEKVFDPAALDTPGYTDFSKRMRAIAGAAQDDLDLVIGFHLAWQNDPFSHFQLRRSHQSAAEMVEGFDHMRVGGHGARLEFEGDLAILTVHTMMGQDTIEIIEKAYNTIAESDARALVIDVRQNAGGAFAVVPLVGHVIDVPLEAGYFVSNKWSAAHDRQPNEHELATIQPWTGWSIKAFWDSVQSEGLIKLRFEPREPNFDGPTFVVTDHASASATEMAVDALRNSGLVTIVGEHTAGHMLSQSFFDTTENFVVVLPVADYYSMSRGRIEGMGIDVDVQAASAEALDVAKNLARQSLTPGE